MQFGWRLSPAGRDVTFLIQCQLFAQKEIFRRHCWAWTEAKSKVAHGIDDEREEKRWQLANMAKST